MTCSLNRDIASPVSSKRPGHIWKAVCHLKVYEDVVVRLGKVDSCTHNSAILDCSRQSASRDTPGASYFAFEHQTGPVRT